MSLRTLIQSPLGSILGNAKVSIDPPVGDFVRLPTGFYTTPNKTEQLPFTYVTVVQLGSFYDINAEANFSLTPKTRNCEKNIASASWRTGVSAGTRPAPGDGVVKIRET